MKHERVLLRQHSDLTALVLLPMKWNMRGNSERRFFMKKMKRLTHFLLLSAMLCALLSTTTFAAQYQYTTVEVNGAQIVLDTPAVVDNNNRTIVPLSSIAVALDMSVNWYSEYQCAEFVRDYTQITAPKTDSAKGYVARECFVFFINSTSFLHEVYWSNLDEPETTETIMDTVPRILNNRTYAPVVYLANAAGYDVAWDGATKTVIIYTAGTAQPAVSTPEPGANMNLAGIGQRHATYWFDFTVNSIWRGEEFDGYRAYPGYILYVASITETNTFGEALPMFDTDFYLSSSNFNGYVYPTVMEGSQYMPESFTLANGQTSTYYIVFEIPKSITTDLQLCYTEIAEGGKFGNSFSVVIY